MLIERKLDIKAKVLFSFSFNYHTVKLDQVTLQHRESNKWVTKKWWSAVYGMGHAATDEYLAMEAKEIFIEPTKQEIDLVICKFQRLIKYEGPMAILKKDHNELL